MDPSTLKLILSAAIGALLSGLFNHIYRRREAAIDRKKRERRAAFIYVARLIRFKITADVVTDICRSLGAGVVAAIADFRKDHPSDVSDDELICVYLYEEFKKSPHVLSPLDYDNFMTTTLSWHRNLEKMMDFRLDIDQLSTLPKEVSIEYSIFESCTDQLKVTMDSVVEWMKTKRDPGVSQIFGAWLSVKIFFESNERLLASLRKYAEISDVDYKKAFDAQNLTYRKFTAISLITGRRVEEILTALKERNINREMK
jgi:hypothetical protein